jgi:hypothetical protein
MMVKPIQESSRNLQAFLGVLGALVLLPKNSQPTVFWYLCTNQSSPGDLVQNQLARKS